MSEYLRGIRAFQNGVDDATYFLDGLGNEKSLGLHARVQGFRDSCLTPATLVEPQGQTKKPSALRARRMVGIHRNRGAEIYRQFRSATLAKKPSPPQAD
jgi:hypothetical protein